MSIRRAVVVPLSALLAGFLTTMYAQADPKTPGDGVLPAEHSLRSPVTDENFYFVMADRFDNGDTANDDGRPRRRPAGVRLRPDQQGLLQRR